MLATHWSFTLAKPAGRLATGKLKLFGVRLEVASAFALFLWFLTFVAIVPVGLVVALKEGLDWRSLRQIGREVAE